MITTIETLPILRGGGSLVCRRTILSDSLPGGDGEGDKARGECLTHLKDCDTEWQKLSVA